MLEIHRSETFSRSVRAGYQRIEHFRWSRASDALDDLTPKCADLILHRRTSAGNDG